MPYYTTTYYVNGSPYGACIQATDRTHAQILAAQRGLGEVVFYETGKPEHNILVGEILSRDPLQWDDMAAVIHAACWLGFLALAAGVARPHEVLGDTGLVHRLAHLAALDPHDPERQIEDIRQLAHDLESRVPGFPMHAESVRTIEIDGFADPAPLVWWRRASSWARRKWGEK